MIYEFDSWLPGVPSFLITSHSHGGKKIGPKTLILLAKVYLFSLKINVTFAFYYFSNQENVMNNKQFDNLLCFWISPLRARKSDNYIFSNPEKKPWTKGKQSGLIQHKIRRVITIWRSIYKIKKCLAKIYCTFWDITVRISFITLKNSMNSLNKIYYFLYMNKE